MFKKILILFFLLLPNIVFLQNEFKIKSGVNIVSTNNPYIILYNTELENDSGDDDFTDGIIWGLVGNSTVQGTSIIKFSGLKLNNPDGFTLSGNTTINYRLDMINGDINLNGYSLEIGTSTTNPGEINWTSGAIIGPLKRWFAPSTNLTQSSGIFPIGNNSTNRNVIINYTQAPTDGGYIIVEYKNGIPSMVDNYSGLPLWASDGQVVQNYEDEGYFEITPNNSTSSLNTKQYKLTIRANSLMNMNDRSLVRLIKSPGPDHNTWVACGNHTSINGTSNNDFTVTSDNVVGFSWFNFGSQNNNPLPVELTQFDGIAYPRWNVVVWTTASEQNSSHFDLEISTDGEEWRKITTKQAAGNSTEEIKYSYIDYNLNSVTYYRLQQFDIDGQFKTYGPILVTKTITEKKIVKYINLMGQEINPKYSTGVVIEIYDDGTMRKMIR